MPEPLAASDRTDPATAHGLTEPGRRASRVVVVGSINLDLSVATAHLPAPGETVPGTTLSRQLGGKGAIRQSPPRGLVRTLRWSPRWALTSVAGGNGCPPERQPGGASDEAIAGVTDDVVFSVTTTCWP